MENKNTNPSISPFVDALLPNASEAEREHAQANVDRYLDVLLRIYTRLELEGKLPITRDKKDARARLDS